MRSEGMSTYVSIKLADGGRGRRWEAVEKDTSIISHPLEATTLSYKSRGAERRR